MGRFFAVGRVNALHDVNINTPVRFEEFERLLSQCENSLSYYFKPLLLHTKIIREPEETLKKRKKGDTESEKLPKNDVELVLRGAFVIRTN